MKEFFKQFSSFVSKYGLEISKVFDDFLQYIIWAHTLPEYGKKIEGWSYTPSQSKEMYDMYCNLILAVKPEIDRHGWFDAFGFVYEDMIAGKFRRSNSGQFFTPPSICDLMTDINAPKEQRIVGKTISDPTCGSGRNLLAFHAKHVGNYYVAEDIDRTCCMMTVCNFIIHGVEGEVIWHNTLQPNTFYGGWKTNEQLNSLFSQYRGIPHVREISYDDTLLKKINDKSAEVFRIKEKLSEAYKKQLAALSTIRSGKSTSENRKQQITTITKRINNIKKLMKKYE